MMNIVSTTSDLMQDFKTGSECPAPYALVYRNMSIMRVDGIPSYQRIVFFFVVCSSLQQFLST
ncbi:unnamed protein product, partial [Vitis vinifera]